MKRYEDKPCKACGATLRYVSNQSCIFCANEKAKKYSRDNRSTVVVRQRKWRQENPDKALDHYYQHNYGISFQEYQEMLEEQEHACGICRRPEADFSKRLFVDHDHITGAVRALLCGPCNTSIGLMQEDPNLLREAALYLEKHVIKGVQDS